jgi:excisionase family DNA binding protein
MPDELLTVAEVANLLRLNQQTVRNMIDRGELGAVRVGQRRVRIRQSQLDAFLAAGETAPATERTNDQGGVWRAVSDAAEQVVAAADRQDRHALTSALAELTNAAQAIQATHG